MIVTELSVGVPTVPLPEASPRAGLAAGWDVIHVAVREGDAPAGWAGLTPAVDDIPPEDREVARFVYNDGRPYAQLEPPAAPTTPAILPQQEEQMEVGLERWVREKWHYLLRNSGLHHDSGALPAEEPNPPA